MGIFALLAAVVSAAASGVIGQSQPADAEPLPFLTATVIGDRDGNVYVNGQWRVSAGRTLPERLTKSLAHPLKFDGRDIYAYHRNSGELWLVKTTSAGLEEVRKAVTFPTYEWALRFAVAPDGCRRGLAEGAKFAVLDRKNRKVLGFSAEGVELGTLVDFSCLSSKSPVESVGFFAETGDILIGTGYPERCTHRFGVGGTEIVDGSWPFAAEAVDYPVANGRTWAVSCTVKEVTCRFAQAKRVGEGELYSVNSIAWTGKGYWLGTTRGAEYYEAEDLKTVARRLGGTGDVTTLVLLDRRIFFTVDSRICMHYLDDLPDEPMDSDDYQFWHLGGYRHGRVTGVVRRDGKLIYGFVPDGGSPETWQFDYRIKDWTHRADRLHKIDEPPPTSGLTEATEGDWTVAYSPERKAILRRKEARK